MNVLANEIKKRRKERRLSQSVAAALAGVSMNVVRAIEEGKKTVQVNSLEKILNLFGLELDIREQTK